jgi:hypothetical protein
MWIWLLASGCSFMLEPVGTCATAQDCHTAFGIDYVCNQDSGYCEQTDILDERCTTFPSNLIDKWFTYVNQPMIGGMVNRSSYVAETAAMELAVQQMNDTHGFSAVVCDNGQDDEGDFDGLSDFDATERLAAYLVDTFDVPVLVGPGSTTLALAALEVLEDKDAVLISAMAGGDGLRDAAGGQGTDADSKRFWRTVGPELYHVTSLVQFFEDNQSYGDVLILHEMSVDDATADANHVYMLDDLTSALESKGYTVWVERHSSQDLIEQQSWLSLLPQRGIDAMVFFNDQPRNYRTFISALDAESHQPWVDPTIDMYLGPNGLHTELLKMVPSAFAQEIRTFGPGLPRGLDRTRFEVFAGEFQEATKLDASENPYAAYTYDAVMLAYFGIAGANAMHNDVTGSTIIAGLTTLGEGDTSFNLDPTEFTAALTAFSLGERIELQGATGTLNWNPDAHVIGPDERLTKTDIVYISPDEAAVQYHCDGQACEDVE